MSGRLIGEAYISLLADSDLLHADADAKTRRALSGVQGTVRIKGDFKEVNSEVAALAATLKGLSGTVRLNTRGAIADIDQLETAVLGLWDKLDSIPADINDSKMLGKLYGARGVVSDLAKQMEDFEPDGNMDKLLSKFYKLDETVKGLQTEASHIDPDMNIGRAEARIGELGKSTQALSSELADMRANINDAALLSKIATAQAQVLKFAKSLRNMPVTADTLPFEADLFKLMSQVETLRKLEQSGAVKEGPAFLDPVSYASAITALGGMEHRLATVDEYLKRTGEVGTGSFKALSAAITSTSARLGKLQAAGVRPENIGQVKALDTAIQQLAKDTGLAADTASKASQGYGVWGRAIAVLSTKIPLFGGALTALHFPAWLAQASGVHILTEAVIEFVAIWGPATIALASFGGLAYKTVKYIYGQFVNMNTVTQATNQHFQGMKGTFQAFEKAVQPSVMQLFGDYLMLAGNNANHFSGVMQTVGRVLDDFGARITIALNSKTTSKFLNQAASDINGLGLAFTQVGRIIGLLLKDVPGYAGMLLKLGTGALTMSADIVQALNPVIALFLKFHGAIFYIGLATTAILALGRGLAAAAIAKNAGLITSSLGVAGVSAANWARDFTGDNEKVAASAGRTGSKLERLGVVVGNMAGGLVAGGIAFGKYLSSIAKAGSLSGAASASMAPLVAGLTKIPGIATAAEGGLVIFGTALKDIAWGPIGLVIGGIAALVGLTLVIAFSKGTDAATKFGAAMKRQIVASNIVNVQQNIASAIKATTAAMHQQVGTGETLQRMAADPRARAGQAYAAKELSTYNGQIRQYVSDSSTAAIRTGDLTRQFGSLGSVTEILSLAGVKQSDIVSANAKAWALDEQKIQATAHAYGFMSESGTAATAQLDTLNISTGQVTKSLQALTGAESQWITLITGGDSAFTAYEQGFANLSGAIGNSSKNAPAVTVRLGKLTERFAAVGATMKGTSAASLAVRQAFDAQLSAGVTLFGNLQTLTAASGNTKTAQIALARSGKDIIAQLLPFAAGSKQATAEVSALAQIMGGPATSNFKVLARWVGRTKGAESDLNNQQAKLTISSANLTTASKNLGNAITTDVTQMEAAKIATANLGGAVSGLYNVSKSAHHQVTGLAVTMAGQYMTALKNSGINTNTAKEYLNAYLKQLGYSKTAIQEIDANLGASVSKWQKYDAVVNANTRAAKANAKATVVNMTAFQGLEGVLPGSTVQLDKVWQALVKQDSAMVTSGKDATGAKSQFIDFAQNGLGITRGAADALWAKFGHQNLDTLAGKAASTRNKFVDFAQNGLKLTQQQAQTLWGEFTMQNLDMLITKGGHAKGTFIELAVHGLGLTKASAGNLWSTLKNQYLDTLAGKAGETKKAFEKTAGSLGSTKAAADKLWDSLHKLASGSPYNTQVNDNISGSGGIVAKANIPGQPQLSARLNFSAAAHGLRGGGVVPAGGGPAGVDGHAYRLAPGELVIPSSHAAMAAPMAKKWGLPGMAGGGFVPAAGSQAGTIGQVEPWTAGQGSSFSAKATAAFVSGMASAVKNNLMTSGSNWSGAVPGGFGNLLVIARYLMANGLNRAAAAGIAATVYGESAGNPESVGSGGFGLIGWTGNTIGLPPGYHGPTGNVQRDMAAQLKGIIGYMNSRGGAGPLNSAGNPVAAGDVWSRYEAPLVPLSDTRPAIANEIFAQLGGGTAAQVKQAIQTQKRVAGKVGQVRPHSAGGVVNEPVFGTGKWSGLPYSFAESGKPEYVGPLSGAAQGPSGMQSMTSIQGQQVAAQLGMVVKLLGQLPTVLARSISAGSGNGVRHGYYRAQN